MVPISRPAPLLDKSLPHGLLRWQAVVTVLAGMAAALFAGKTVTLSLLAGASVLWLGQLCFVWLAFRHTGTAALGGFYQGILGKFLIVIVGLSLVLSWLQPLNGVALFAGMLMVQAVAWVYPLWQVRQPDRPVR